jgi:LexA-binding, inner membrane-associated putative hydrolase
VTVVSHFFWGWYVFRTRPWVWRFAAAAVAPDLPYLVLLGYYSLCLRVNGFADLGAWDLAWRSPIVCALHSFVPWAFTTIIASLVCRQELRHWLLPVWAGWLSHVVIDMFTHRSDGYPIFFPLASYRFATPVSYWEPTYHGRIFALIDTTLMVALFVHHLLRRRWLQRRPAGFDLRPVGR